MTMSEKFDLIVDYADNGGIDVLTFSVIHDCDDEDLDNDPTCWGSEYRDTFIWITKNSCDEYVAEIKFRNDREIRELYKNINFSVVCRWITHNIYRYV